MRKLRFMNYKTLAVLGAGLCLAGCVFTNQRVSASSMDDTFETNAVVCAEDNEDIWYEVVDDRISSRVEDEGEVSDEISLKNGYFHRISTSEGESVVGGIQMNGKNYVFTMDSDKEISDKDVKRFVKNTDWANITETDNTDDVVE